jgi:cellulose biosynthesis protein BcsQ
MKNIAFVSGKGGVGKTTLAFLLGLVLEQADRPLGFLDLDPQGSLNGPSSAKQHPSVSGGSKENPAILLSRLGIRSPHNAANA